MLASQKQFEKAFVAALSTGNVLPYFQPIVSCVHRRITGFEVLARWVDPEHGIIGPDIFIPVAEEAGLLGALMETIMRQAFKAAHDWPQHLGLAFNLSPAQLRDPDLPERIELFAREGEFPLERIKMEITETAIIEDAEGAEVMLNRIRGLGCDLALDDFGTGYSSLTWLRTLPFDTIKIDASFVRTMMTERQSRKIVTAVVGLGQSLGLDVIAEGAETAEEVAFLQRIGCSHIQGYFFGRPMSAAAVSACLADGTKAVQVQPYANATFEQRAAQITALYQAPEIAICFLDRNFVLVDISESMARRFGLSVEEAIGRSIHELAPQDVPRVAWLRSFRERGLPYPPYEFTYPEGHVDLVTLTRVEDEAGEVMGYGLFGVDVTDRKKAEQALRETEQHYRVSAELSMRIVWQLDAEGRMISFDEDHYGKMLGVTNAEVAGDGWLKVIHPDDRKRVVADLQRAIETEQVYDNEMRVMFADGHVRWARAYAAPFRASDGSVVKWFGETEDIDARKRADDILRDSEEYHRIAAMLTPRLVWKAAPSGHLIAVDERYSTVPDVEPEKLLGWGWLDVIHPEDRDVLLASWKQAVTTGETYDHRSRVRTLDENYIWVRTVATPQRAPDGTIESWFGITEYIAG